RAGSNAQARLLGEATDPSRWQCSKMEAMLVIGIEPVMVHVDRNYIRQWKPVHIRTRVPGTMEHKRNQRQRPAQPQRRASLHQLPFSLGCLLLASLWLPDVNLAVVITLAAGIRRHVTRNQAQNPDLIDGFRHELITASTNHRFGGRLAQYNERRHIAPIHPTNLPIDDLLRRIERDVSPLFDNILPVHQRSGTANAH